MKLNIDGSFLAQTGEAGVGVIIRNSEGGGDLDGVKGAFPLCIVG
jgi:ribonuclease HI